MAERRIRTPELKGGPWFNSEPLAIAELKGKVVVVDFWTYSCVNCLRTLPYLKEWHRRYAKDGLVVIGVHSPEFEFEKDPGNVGDFLRRNALEYPVVMDNAYTIWQAYANQYWPHHYFIDADGYIRYDHIGEGGYEQSELIIQTLLSEANPSLSYLKVSEVAEESEAGAVCYPMSAELYTGFARGAIGNPVVLEEDRPQMYRDGGVHEEGFFYLDGAWLETPEYARHARATAFPEDYLAIEYHGLEVNAVMGPATRGKTFRVYLAREGRPLPESACGADVSADERGTYVAIDIPRMYRIIEEEAYGKHELKLITDSDQLQVYAFTFGGCTAPPAVRDEQRRIA